MLDKLDKKIKQLIKFKSWTLIKLENGLFDMSNYTVFSILFFFLITLIAMCNSFFSGFFEEDGALNNLLVEAYGVVIELFVIYWIFEYISNNKLKKELHDRVHFMKKSSDSHAKLLLVETIKKLNDMKDTHIDLSHTDLSGCDFSNLNLAGSTFKSSKFDEDTKFENTNLSQCNLEGMAREHIKQICKAKSLEKAIFDSHIEQYVKFDCNGNNKTTKE